jgi:hypothetical protein
VTAFRSNPQNKIRKTRRGDDLKSEDVTDLSYITTPPRSHGDESVEQSTETGTGTGVGSDVSGGFVNGWS